MHVDVGVLALDGGRHRRAYLCPVPAEVAVPEHEKVKEPIVAMWPPSKSAVMRQRCRSAAAVTARLIVARVLTVAILLAIVGTLAFYVAHTALDEDGFETVSTTVLVGSTPRWCRRPFGSRRGG
jgi:hypothetical protein